MSGITLSIILACATALYAWSRWPRKRKNPTRIKATRVSAVTYNLGFLASREMKDDDQYGPPQTK